jgi:anti-sigma factor (TIGR02949 family)
MITCHEAVGRLWEYLDRTVDAVDRARVEEHLARCRRCCAEMEFAQELRRVLVDVADVDVPRDVLARLNRTLEDLDR